VGAPFYLASGLMTLGLVLALGLPAESRTADITADA
jgi:hypothetical protein